MSAGYCENGSETVVPPVVHAGMLPLLLPEPPPLLLPELLPVMPPLLLPELLPEPLPELPLLLPVVPELLPVMPPLLLLLWPPLPPPLPLPPIDPLVGGMSLPVPPYGPPRGEPEPLHAGMAAAAPASTNNRRRPRTLSSAGMAVDSRYFLQHGLCPVQCLPMPEMRHSRGKRRVWDVPRSEPHSPHEA